MLYINTSVPRFLVTPASPGMPKYVETPQTPQNLIVTKPICIIDSVRQQQLRRTTDDRVKKCNMLRELRARQEQTRRENIIKERRSSVEGQPVLLVNIVGQIQRQRNAVELAAKALSRLEEEEKQDMEEGKRSSPLKRLFSLTRKQRGGSVRNQIA